MIDKTNGYKKALQLAKEHYENFPVVSVFIPKGLRKDVAVIYWFGRTSDDISDEGVMDTAERLKMLNQFEEDFQNALNGNFKNDYFAALAETIAVRKLDTSLFTDLLSAFRQDITTNRYQNFSEILDYCRRSANPVGRLVLQLHGYFDEQRGKLSDKICTSLQLINFYQDLNVDFLKNRLYIPTEEISSFGLREDLMFITERNPQLEKLIETQLKRAEKLMHEGMPLIKLLKGRLRVEIAATCYGGLKMAEIIRKNGFTSYLQRATLRKIDFFSIFMKALVKCR
ncbi:MAG: squalene synthase HpnC [Ignavibacteriales bacterium]|nr:MAG: squalene synthase HpnC [Ignavibacteriaceae bacterium]MBW7872219.1 squalene synthase HpnC [Ignavibacteria bacterium]MCZ2144032.1 squalene synthase HpnC [Ignavibacteriales bacterium]OQY70461.1 MAG: squalene synthase HpnC [Ignavibacteriales bacterium UTCHB3]MBV6445635.1 Hydroxysqualene synthase [Ignavibacteriaceae bacterium]